MPAYITPHPDGTYLAVKVHPRASRNEIGEVLGSEIKIKVTAPPVDSSANEAVVRLLAKQLRCPRNSVRIVRGQTTRHKVILIHGLDPNRVRAGLETTSV